MRRSLRVVAALAALVILALSAPGARAAVITGVRALPEAPVWSISSPAGFALANATALGGHVLPSSRGVRIVAVALHVSGSAGGGAGSTVVTITDGTNTCTATIACTLTNGIGPDRVATLDGSGTVCSFPPGASLTATVTTAGCTTTRPSASVVEFLAQP